MRIDSFGQSENDTLSFLDQYWQQDIGYKKGNIFNSICSYPDEIAIQAYVKSIETNLGDNKIFPGSLTIVRLLLQEIGELFGQRSVIGDLTSGGTEANLLAAYVAKNRFPKITQPEIIIPESIHFSMEKTAKLLGITLQIIKLNDCYQVNVSAVQNAINKNTIAIFVSAGTSETGAVDEIDKLGKIAKTHDLYFHVDAATGGFILPFARHLGYSLPDISFNQPYIDSLTIDPHKYGYAVIPCGVILYGDSASRELIKFNSFFHGTSAHYTLLGSRTGAGAASALAVIKTLGFNGFVKRVQHLFYLRDYLVNQLTLIGLPPLISPTLTIVLVKHPDPVDIMNKLMDNNLVVSVSTKIHAIRIVIHRHHTKQNIDRLIAILRLC